MKVFTWFYGEPPKDMEVRQVYAIAFSADGRVLLKIKQTKQGAIYTLAGGHIEKFDKDREEALRREYVEEVNTTLQKDIHLIGYQEVREAKDVPVYAQIRMVAMIDKIGENRPDLDGGEVYERLLVSSKRAIKLLNWGRIGKQVVKGAVKIAKEKFGLKFTNKQEDFV